MLGSYASAQSNLPTPPDQTKHGASQGVSWTKCQDCGAVLMRAQIVLAFWDSYATMCVVHNG